jgi:hypothetical protein
MSCYDPTRLIFLDETSSYLHTSRAYGWAATWQRVTDRAPKGKKHRSSLLAAVSQQGLQGCLLHEGSVNKASFLSYLKDVLLPNVEPNSVLIMDNWTVHRGKDITALVQSFGCSVLYLPTYSPDFNPIEHLFAKIKSFV